MIPIDYQTGRQGGSGLDDVELAAKYRFLHQSDGGWIPDIAIFPRFFLPTASRRFGTPHLGLFPPLWAQKDFGEWSLFGGGGYTIDPGAGQRNFWQGGLGVSRAVTDRFSLGAEIYLKGRIQTMPDPSPAPILASSIR